METELPRLYSEDGLGRCCEQASFYGGGGAEATALLGKENLLRGDVEFAGSSFISDFFQDSALQINLLPLSTGSSHQHFEH